MTWNTPKTTVWKMQWGKRKKFLFLNRTRGAEKCWKLNFNEWTTEEDWKVEGKISLFCAKRSSFVENGKSLQKNTFSHSHNHKCVGVVGKNILPRGCEHVERSIFRRSKMSTLWFTLGGSAEFLFRNGKTFAAIWVTIYRKFLLINVFGGFSNIIRISQYILHVDKRVRREGKCLWI